MHVPPPIAANGSGVVQPPVLVPPPPDVGGGALPSEPAGPPLRDEVRTTWSRMVPKLW